MKFSKFLADKAVTIIISMVTWLIIWDFLAAFHIKSGQIFIIGFVYFLSGIINILWEYFRRYRFYNDITSDCDNLEKKYLLSSMTENPDFYEGQLFYEILCETNKSMCDSVAEYRKSSEEFQEYIELWVHEIKLPVASLLLMCHNNPDIDGKYTEQLRRIDDCIENVMYYARSENVKKDYLIKEVSLKRIFSKIALKNREELLQRNVTIKTENLDTTVMTDGKWLEYIMGQIIANSMKYFSADRQPEISIYTTDSAEKTTLHIRDNGIGISASDLPYIFEKSYTGTNGRTHAKSTGMGLYIIKNLCDSLGHDVKADSVQGEFTDISISFGKNDFMKM
ncbi:MAG: sensor histidine kinase [Prevotella sp.]|nr:sensor histidine kinase [Alistipes senegalensis]MCM1358476.1 sensor histidine kinase [Prevotella sp.]MCM1473692.1 sensor histidine kinase [Muribaculaceae bacterium]